MEINKICSLKATEQGGRTGDNYSRNQHGVLSVGRHVCMFIVDDVLSKLKKVFHLTKESKRIVQIGSSLHFHREKDLYLSFLQVRIVIMFSSVSI